MRGKRGENRGKGLASGLIPAHAGKTERMRWTSGNRRAHPRSCGENRTRGVPGGYFTGSSPLTRGKPVRRCSPIHKGGLISAHAGKTSRTLAQTTFTTAHPHSRGENLRVPARRSARLGSSPLMRGKRDFVRTCDLQGRLIPAHAGKTWYASARPQRSRAHPR